MWRPPTYEGASPRNVIVTLVSYVPVLLAGVVGLFWLVRRERVGPAAVPLFSCSCGVRSTSS